MRATLLPRPFLSAVLFLVWLLIWASAAPGIVVLGVIVALGLPLFTQSFWLDYLPVANTRALLRLTVLFLYDVVVANLKLLPLILGRSERLRPGFIVVDLDIRHPLAISIFASLISLTPGTVSSNVSADRRKLLVHVFDRNPNEDESLAAELKLRYEAPLKEIFEC